MSRETVAAKRDRLRAEEAALRKRIEAQAHAAFKDEERERIQEETRAEVMGAIREELADFARLAGDDVLGDALARGWTLKGADGIPDPLPFEARELVAGAILDRLQWHLT